MPSLVCTHTHVSPSCQTCQPPSSLHRSCSCPSSCSDCDHPSCNTGHCGGKCWDILGSCIPHSPSVADTSSSHTYSHRSTTLVWVVGLACDTCHDPPQISQPYYESSAHITEPQLKYVICTKLLIVLRLFSL